MTKEEELAKYMATIERYKEEMNTLEMQAQYLQAALNDYHKAKLTVDHLSNVEKDTEVLLPIGGGTFITATAKKTEKVLFNVGADIVIEKTSKDVIKKIDSRLEELEKTRERLDSMMQQLQAEATEISAKAQKLAYEEE